MRKTGLALIALCVILQIPLYWPLAANANAIALFSQFLGSSALILMAIAQILALRLPGQQMIFGPLDQIYRLHKWLAIAALVAMALHDIIDADIDGLQQTALSDIAEEFGEISLYGIMILIFISIATLIPYPVWRATHKFIGLAYAMALFHFAFIAKPFNNTDPLGLYLLAITLPGLAAYIWLLLKPLYTRGHPYRISALTRLNDSLDITFQPEGRPVRHKAGQFAFFRLQSEGLEEVHPFTISSGPQEDGSLRISVKALGDYTRALHQQAAIGQRATISPAYGHFTRLPNGTAQIWIGAGIGITPFLAWAHDAQNAQNHPITAPVHIYYCVRSETPDYLNELTSFASQHEAVSLHLINSRTQPRLSAERVAADLGQDLAHAHIAFCGPTAMGQNLETALRPLGVKSGAFHREAFELRSGIGLQPFFLQAFAWLAGKFQKSS